MPRKPNLKLTMTTRPPLPTRAWLLLVLNAVRATKGDLIEFEFAVVDDPKQLGRVVLHHVGSLLADRTPLWRLLDDCFGIRLREGQELDLLTLIGRECEAKFDKGVNGTLQAIVQFQQRRGRQDESPAPSPLPVQPPRTPLSGSATPPSTVASNH